MPCKGASVGFGFSSGPAGTHWQLWDTGLGAGTQWDVGRLSGPFQPGMSLGQHLPGAADLGG